jgi:hypothetical protein
MIHVNSIKSFQELKPNKRAAKIYEKYVGTGFAMTDREIAERMGFADLNQVRPRISEMINLGFLRECGKVKDSVTGKTVRIVEVNKEDNNQLRFV